DLKVLDVERLPQQHAEGNVGGVETASRLHPEHHAAVTALVGLHGRDLECVRRRLSAKEWTEDERRNDKRHARGRYQSQSFHAGLQGNTAQTYQDLVDSKPPASQSEDR